MKKIITIHIILIALLFTPLVATSTRINHIAGKRIYVQDEKHFTLDVLTVYHPTKRQCDRTPLVTASNSKIDLESLRNKNIRWMALSRDLLKRWKGEFQYGDTVMLSAKDAEINGLWVIKDTMNKRFKNRGDLLFDGEVRKLGKWTDVEIVRVTGLNL